MSIQAVAWVLENSQSRGIARLVLISLANHHNGGTGQCNPGYRRIAAEAGCGKSAVTKAVQDLVTLGELEVMDVGDNRRSARYHLPFSVHETDTPCPAGGRSVRSGMDAASGPGADRSLNNRNEPELVDFAEVLETVDPDAARRVIEEARHKIGRGRSKTAAA